MRAESKNNPIFDLAGEIPPPETEITRLLKSELELVPGGTFHGRVAVMTGRILPKAKEWWEITRVNYLAQFATGNLHSGPDLWRDKIPTLMEYGPLITPAYS